MKKKDNTENINPANFTAVSDSAIAINEDCYLLVSRLEGSHILVMLWQRGDIRAEEIADYVAADTSIQSVMNMMKENYYVSRINAIWNK